MKKNIQDDEDEPGTQRDSMRIEGGDGRNDVMLEDVEKLRDLMADWFVTNALPGQDEAALRTSDQLRYSSGPTT